MFPGLLHSLMSVAVLNIEQIKNGCKKNDTKLYYAKIPDVKDQLKSIWK